MREAREGHPGAGESSVGIVQTQYFTFAEPPGEMALDSGAKLGPITLAYETYGTLNEAKSNAVLIVHALSGDAHVAGKHHPNDRKPGWWDTMVGPGKGFDTNRYFVICSNIIGGCMGSTGPSSIDPKTGNPYGLTFPIITIGDMVRAQWRLMDRLGIEKLLAVAGGSMGGMQVLEWATRYPERVRAAIVIASSHVSMAQAIAFDAVGRNAIQADPAFNAGTYYGREVPARGLSIARMLGHITYLSDESMRAKFGRALRDGGEFRYEFASEFSVEAYLDHQGEQFVNRFDANSYLYITKAVDYFDVSSAYGSLDKAMARVQGKSLVLSYSSDWLYPPYQSEEIVHALMRQRKDVSYCCIRSHYGHDAFLLEVDVMTDVIRGFLDHILPSVGVCHYRESCGTCCPLNQGLPPRDNRCVTCRPEAAALKSAMKHSIYEGRRVDYELIVDLVEQGSRVLDIGCGDGGLLCRLKAQKNVAGMGIELAQDEIVRCFQRGVSVVQADVDKGLGALPDQSFDYVILSMTLQVIQRPDVVLREMLRVGKKCIVSFPNFAHWFVRIKTLLLGRAPVTRSLPYSWYETPNLHVLSVKDFRAFCAAQNARIEKEIPLTSRGAFRFWPNLFAEEALYVISAK